MALRSRSPDDQSGRRRARSSVVEEPSLRAVQASVGSEIQSVRGQMASMGAEFQQMSSRIDALASTLQTLASHMVQQAQQTQSPQPSVPLSPVSPVAVGRAVPGSLVPSPERPAGIQENGGFFEQAHPSGASASIPPEGFGQEHNPAPSAAGSRMSVDEGKSMSRADKWLGPIDKPKIWKGRLEEIVGFQSYFSYLQSYPREMSIARASRSEIVQSSLSGSEVVRSVRLQSLLLQLFSEVSKANGILLAYSESCENPCGYESLRLLCREFSLYSTTEALPLRNRILSKTYKESSITELFNAFDLEVARYGRLISSLGGAPGSHTLELSDADKSTIVLRSRPERCREWTVLGLQGTAFSDVRERELCCGNVNTDVGASLKNHPML